MNRVIDTARAAFWISAAVLVLACSMFVYRLYNETDGLRSQLLNRVDLVGERLGARDKQIAAILKNVNDFVDDTYYDNKANVETTAVILREVAEVLRITREDLLPELSLTVKQANALVVQMRQDVGKLTGTAEVDLRTLDSTLASAGDLLRTLEGQVKDGAPEVTKTVNSLNTVLSDVDRLLTDPSVAGTLKNVEGTTAALKGSAESVEIALKPLRDKARLLKIVLLKALSMVKISVNQGLW